MAIRITAQLDRRYKTEVQGVVRAMAKKHKTVAVMPESRVDCPNCLYDRVHNASSGKYNGTGAIPFTGPVCPVCRGDGVIVETRSVPLTASIVLSDNANAFREMAQGQLAIDEAIVKVLPRQHTALESASYITIDGRKYSKVGSVQKRGLVSHALSWVHVQEDR